MGVTLRRLGRPIAFAALLGAAAAPRDPLGLDPGEANDQAAFVAWVRAPRTAPRHPLECLRNVVHTSKLQTNDYFRFFNAQTGLAGEAAIQTRRLAELLNDRAPLANTVDLGLLERKRLKATGDEIEKVAARFFALVPRAQRERVYLVAEKFEEARLSTLDLVRSAQTEATDAWLAQVAEEDARADVRYLAGVLQGRDAAARSAILDDYKLTVDFLLTFAGPPPFLHGKDRDAFRGKKARERRAILARLAPLAF